MAKRKKDIKVKVTGKTPQTKKPVVSSSGTKAAKKKAEPVLPPASSKRLTPKQLYLLAKHDTSVVGRNKIIKAYDKRKKINAYNRLSKKAEELGVPVTKLLPKKKAKGRTKKRKAYKPRPFQHRKISNYNVFRKEIAGILHERGEKLGSAAEFNKMAGNIWREAAHDVKTVHFKGLIANLDLLVDDYMRRYRTPKGEPVIPADYYDPKDYYELTHEDLFEDITSNVYVRSSAIWGGDTELRCGFSFPYEQYFEEFVTACNHYTSSKREASGLVVWTSPAEIQFKLLPPTKEDGKWYVELVVCDSDGTVLGEDSDIDDFEYSPIAVKAGKPRPLYDEAAEIDEDEDFEEVEEFEKKAPKGKKKTEPDRLKEKQLELDIKKAEAEISKAEVRKLELQAEKSKADLAKMEKLEKWLDMGLIDKKEFKKLISKM